MGFVSPNQLAANGIEIMLGGKPPADRSDQVVLMNFVAHNIDPAVAEAASRLMKVLMPEYFGLLTEAEVTEIAQYQIANPGEGS